MLGVGTKCSSATRDVDVLSVVRNMLQGKLGTVARAQAHGTRSQCVSSLTHFCRKEKEKKSIYIQHERAHRWCFNKVYTEKESRMLNIIYKLKLGTTLDQYKVASISTLCSPI